MKYILLLIAISFFYPFESKCNNDLSNHVFTVEDMQATAEKVLNDLKAAKGYLSTEKPKIKVEELSGGQRLAVMNRQDGIISLDIETFEHCQNLGDQMTNALAYIIGHELGHYIHSHGSIDHHKMPGVGNARRVVTPAANNGNLNDAQITNALVEFSKTNDEAEADFEGAFLGYLAGYQPTDAGIELLKKVYEDPDMGLTSITSGYPTLEERQQIIRNTKEDLSKLTPLFEMAKYLTLIGQYVDAIPFLVEISEKFESREIYNNIAVLHIMETLGNIDGKLTIFEFPILFDADFRAPHPEFDPPISAIMGFSMIEEFPDCQLSNLQLPLERAEEYLKKATNIDKNYALAYLNLSIAQSIKGLLFNAPICSAARREQFTQALAHAYKAAEIVEMRLNTFSLEHFDVSPSPSIRMLEFPRKEEFRRLEFAGHVDGFVPADFSTESVTETQGSGSEVVEVTIIKTNRYPFFKEFFGREVLAHRDNGFRLDSLNSVYTRWNTHDMAPPPDGLLYSNIHVQLDIVKLLSGEPLTDNKLKVIGRTKMHETLVDPFSRALELNNNNELAIRNQRALNPGSSTMEVLPLPLIENSVVKYQSVPISERFKNIASWTLTAGPLHAFQLTSYMRSDEIEQKLSATTQNLKYKQSNEFKFYYNRSNFAVNSRVEESMILEPFSFDSLEISADNVINIGNSQEDVNAKLGAPARVTLIKDGKLVLYKTSTDTSSYQFPQFPPFDGPPPNEVFIDGKWYVKMENETIVNVGDEEVPVIEFPLNDSPEQIVLIETKEDGVILHMDGQNKVRGWSIYHKEIRTKPGS